jgi:hypothetical protein
VKGGLCLNQNQGVMFNSSTLTNSIFRYYARVVP